MAHFKPVGENIQGEDHIHCMDKEALALRDNMRVGPIRAVHARQWMVQIARISAE